MSYTICLTTTIQKPKEVVKKMLIDAIGVFKDDLITEKILPVEDDFHFRLVVNLNNFSAPISAMFLTIKIQDFRQVYPNRKSS